MNDHATPSENDVQPGPLASADGDGTAMVPTNARAWGPDIADRLVADGAGTAAAADLVARGGCRTLPWAMGRSLHAGEGLRPQPQHSRCQDT